MIIEWTGRLFYCCLPCSNVLGAQDILLSSLTKTEAVFHCWNSVAMFDAMKHDLACPPPTGICYIFCTVSLLTFTSHCYWDGVASQKHNHCSILFSQGFFLVMMTTLMTVRDLKKRRMTFYCDYAQSTNQIAPMDTVDPSSPKQTGPSGRPQSDLCCNRTGPREGKHWKYLGFEIMAFTMLLYMVW